MSKRIFKLLILVIILAMVFPATALGDSHLVQVTLLHTNDFHGRLETDYRGRGGAAYLASVVNDIRATAGAENVVLIDAGDEYFAAPALSQLLMGESTVDIFNLIGYDLAVLGNHEFDKGQEILSDRVAQSDYPWLGANVVLEGTDWDHPAWALPYTTITVGSPPNQAVLGVIGVTTDETPEVTLKGTTDGLEFKDLTATILHYYDEVMAQADALIVVAHMGSEDSGSYKGLETVAQELIDAEKPVGLMIGGHQHEALFDPIWVGDTAIVAAGYYGRWLGQVDLSIDKAAKQLTVDNYQLNTITGAVTLESLTDDLVEFFDAGAIDSKGVFNSLLTKIEGAQAALNKGNATAAANKLGAFIEEVMAQSGKHVASDAAETLALDAEWFLANTDLEVAARVAYWAEIVAPQVNQIVGYTNISLWRDYNAESIVGDIVSDSMRWKADYYDDGALNGSVDIAVTNPGGLRADITIPDGAALPYTVTWGMTFDVLPFGNTLYLMDLTGVQIQALLDQSASLYKGIMQSSGISYDWCNIPDPANPGTPLDWGAFNAKVAGADLDPSMTYRVVTNDYLAPGRDGWETFSEGTNRWNTYFDMQEGFVEYIGMLEVIDAEDIPMGRINKLDTCP